MLVRILCISDSHPGPDKILCLVAILSSPRSLVSHLGIHHVVIDFPSPTLTLGTSSPFDLEPSALLRSEHTDDVVQLIALVSRVVTILAVCSMNQHVSMRFESPTTEIPFESVSFFYCHYFRCCHVDVVPFVS